MDYDVIIIGAGMAGLTAANYLHGHDLKVHVIEAENTVGGRVRSFKKDGFTLDRGFQVFLPAYPEAEKLLDYDELNLQYFMNGAYILDKEQPFYLVDPLQNPDYIFKTLFSGNVGFTDKLKLFQLKQQLAPKSLEQILSMNSSNTRQELASRGYSFELVKNFFQPFLSGIFLEKNLSTSSAMFDFVVKMFNENGAALPQNGIAAIPEQLYHNLPPNEIELNSSVKEIVENRVVLENGKEYSASHIIIATEGNNKLLEKYSNNLNRDYVSVKNYYYSAPTALVKEPILILNPDENSLINNICYVSKVSAKYAPEGFELLSVTVLDNENVEEKSVRKELEALLDESADSLNFIDSFDIKYALPSQEKIKYSRSPDEIRPEKGIYIAGDFNLYGSLNAAMKSGREVAELILDEMNLRTTI